MKVEYKQFEFKVEEATDSGIIKGYASTFGNVDLGDDVVEKGAFSRTIKNTKGRIPILADHDPSKHLGWNLSASEDDRGLLVEGHLNLQVQAAREKWALAKQAVDVGAKMGLSIGYGVVNAKPDGTNKNVRRLIELKLYEYSIVPFPMNTEAMVLQAKNWAEDRSINDLITEIRIKASTLGKSTSEIISALLEREPASQKHDEICDDPEAPALHSIDWLIKYLNSGGKPNDDRIKDSGGSR